MVIQKTRLNHYVPEWYQKGFIQNSYDKLHYLNLSPNQIILHDGNIKLHRAKSFNSPASCFNQKDLYTTFFGIEINDDIEKLLFGSIDTKGAVAVKAVIDGEQSKLVEYFDAFFEYVDAQRLRTPKGLDWIKAHYPTLTQTELMLEMQSLRLMHCTMWSEAVREIVSAEDADIKFIISDHPVTLYNAEIPLSNIACSYPQDPDISLIGTQTIFPLNEDYCLILTHLEYAKYPQSIDLLKRRTNARFRGTSFVRKDLWIRNRKLTGPEVTAINLLIKKRAKRFIASSQPEWLYPENSYHGDWKKIAQTLLPKSKDLFGFGGDIYIGYKDGSSSFHDPYGRTSKSFEFLKRKKRIKCEKLQDICGCGSGRRFESCCHGLAPDIRPSWDVYSIRERNLMLCNALTQILGIDDGKNWEEVRREINADQVRKIHELISLLWPADTDLTELLPRAQKSVLRAVYQGAPDARTVTLTIISWLAYFDEIIITFPFINPHLTKNPAFNPLKVPTEYKDQTLRNTYLMFVLQPYIELGLVHVIPDFGDFNSEFGLTVMKMVEARTKQWKVTESDVAFHKKIMYIDHFNDQIRLPIEALKKYIKKIMPEIPQDMLEEVAQRFKKDAIADPIAPLQEIGPKNGQFRILKGFNLETSLFLAMLTGSVLFTDQSNHKKQLYAFASSSKQANDSKFNEIISFTNQLIFPLQLNTEKIYQALREGFGSEIRKAILSLLEYTRSQELDSNADKIISEIDAGMHLIHKGETMSDKDIIPAKLTAEIPLNGFDRPEVRRLLLTFSRPELVSTVPILFYAEYPDLEFNRYKSGA
ncbi:DUF4238 domain-containing protein [Methylophilus sp. Leaf408]|uniref:DUF4238 domain-containing protein n=1 Tax=Methylophilus sp. Leaf408 TaxID=2876561 RepID=UPI001E3E034A|nr:DUF4238 domain-containing protein [Methylophilus sp. Leaf408]